MFIFSSQWTTIWVKRRRRRVFSFSIWIAFCFLDTMKYMKLGSKPDAFQAEGSNIRWKTLFIIWFNILSFISFMFFMLCYFVLFLVIKINELSEIDSWWCLSYVLHKFCDCALSFGWFLTKISISSKSSYHSYVLNVQGNPCIYIYIYMIVNKCICIVLIWEMLNLLILYNIEFFSEQVCGYWISDRHRRDSWRCEVLPTQGTLPNFIRKTSHENTAYDSFFLSHQNKHSRT